MGYMRHNSVIVVVSDHILETPEMPDVEAFRKELPDAWRHLVVGPVRAVVNGYVTYAFLPDGSKEGWTASDDGDAYRERFVDLFSFRYEDGSGPFDVTLVEHGGDEDEDLATAVGPR